MFISRNLASSLATWRYIVPSHLLLDTLVQVSFLWPSLGFSICRTCHKPPCVCHNGPILHHIRSVLRLLVVGDGLSQGSACGTKRAGSGFREQWGTHRRRLIRLMSESEDEPGPQRTIESVPRSPDSVCRKPKTRSTANRAPLAWFGEIVVEAPKRNFDQSGLPTKPCLSRVRTALCTSLRQPTTKSSRANIVATRSATGGILPCNMGKASPHEAQSDATAILDADLSPKPPIRMGVTRSSATLADDRPQGDLPEETSWPSASLHRDLAHTVLNGMGASCTERGLATRIASQGSKTWLPTIFPPFPTGRPLLLPRTQRTPMESPRF